ncbi:MAG: sigma-E factor negative regulatory protein [Pseudomonadota bacterium]|nr:sigma-E factor negative regulatory protein [Pseudomonadota bacterium]
MSTRERLSALVDDELGQEEMAALLDAWQQDESAPGCWHAYHLIGETLRSQGQALPGAALDGELAFVTRLGQRLAQEAAARPLAGELAPSAPRQPAAARVPHRGAASNDSNFRWKLVAGAASLAAVSAIAWNASGLLAPASAPELARSSLPPAQILVASPQGTMVRDARLEELLAAHKQFGATSALQEPSGFLRNATFDMPQAALTER